MSGRASNPASSRGPGRPRGVPVKAPRGDSGSSRRRLSADREGLGLTHRTMQQASTSHMPGLPGHSRSSSKLAQELMTNTGRWRSNSSSSFSTEAYSISTARAYDAEQSISNPDWATQVWVWGCSANGQCVEDEKELCISRPRLLTRLPDGGGVEGVVKTIVCGRTVSMAVTELGQIWSWGSGPALGREGHGNRGPAPLEGLPGDVVAVAIGEDHALACNRQGELYAWGLGAGGKLGSGDTANRLLPVHITAAPLHQVVITQLACGQRHSAALSCDGSLFTFGAGRAGQLGHGNLKDQTRPRRLGFFDGEPVAGVSCGANHTAAFTWTGELYCWGWGEHGRLGLGHEELVSTPTLVEGALGRKSVAGVSCGSAHTVVLTADGVVYAFGWNEFGQVRRKHVPVVPTPSSSSGSSSSHDHVLHPVRVLEARQATPGGGDDDDGLYHTDDDVEVDDEEERSASTANLDKNHIIKIGAGFAHSAALTASGRLFLWGFGEEGQLGTGEELSLGLPVEMGLLPEDVVVMDMALGHCHSAAVVSRSSRADLDRRFAKAAHRESAGKALTRFFRMCLLRSRVRMLAQAAGGGQRRASVGVAAKKGGIVDMEEEEEKAGDRPASSLSSSFAEEEEPEEEGEEHPTVSGEAVTAAAASTTEVKEHTEEEAAGEDEEEKVKVQQPEEEAEEAEEEQPLAPVPPTEASKDDDSVKSKPPGPEASVAQEKRVDEGEGVSAAPASSPMDKEQASSSAAESEDGYDDDDFADEDEEQQPGEGEAAQEAAAVAEPEPSPPAAAEDSERPETVTADVELQPTPEAEEESKDTQRQEDKGEEQQEAEGLLPQAAADEEPSQDDDSAAPPSSPAVTTAAINDSATVPEVAVGSVAAAGVAADEELHKEEGEAAEKEVAAVGSEEAGAAEEEDHGPPAPVAPPAAEESGAPTSSLDQAQETVVVGATEEEEGVVAASTSSAEEPITAPPCPSPPPATSITPTAPAPQESAAAAAQPEKSSDGPAADVPVNETVDHVPLPAPAKPSVTRRPPAPPAASARNDAAAASTAPAPKPGSYVRPWREPPKSLQSRKPSAHVVVQVKALPPWGQNKPSTAAKSRGLKGQMQTGHRLQKKWREKQASVKPTAPAAAAAVAEPAAQPEADKVASGGSKGGRASSISVSSSSSDADLRLSQKQHMAYPFRRRSKSLAQLRGLPTANKAAAAPAPAGNNSEAPAAAPPAARGGSKVEAVLMRAKDLRDDYNYFKERYCTEQQPEEVAEEKKPSSSPGRLVHRSSQGEEEEDDEVGSQVEEGSEAGRRQERPPVDDFGEFVRKRTQSGHNNKRASPTGSMSLLSEEGPDRGKSLQCLQKRSVMKMHRRLGLIQHKSAMHLPRSATAQPEDLMGLDGPRREVKRTGRGISEAPKPTPAAGESRLLSSYIHPDIELPEDHDDQHDRGAEEAQQQYPGAEEGEALHLPPLTL